MIGDSVLLSAASVLGFVGGLFGLLLVLAWLEHPEPPSWLRRRERLPSRRRVADSTPAGRPTLTISPGGPSNPVKGVVEIDD
jgi:hypothetical protein